MNIRKIALIVVAVIIVVGIVISNSSQEKHDVKIGAALSLTGMASIDGENMKSGIEFAKLNLERQGINLEIIYEDDGTESGKTVSAIQKLTNVDNVDAIVGPTWSFLASAAAPVIQDKGVVVYNPGNTSEFVEGEGEYFFFGAPKNALKEDPTTTWLKEVGAKKVAIVLEQGGWGDSHITPFTNAINSVGGELIFTERVPFGASGPDIQTIIAKVISSDVDAVLYSGFDEVTALMVNKKQDMRADFSLLVATEIVKKQNEDGKINVSEEDGIYSMTPDTTVAFQEAFKKEYGVLPGAYADRTYDGTMMLVKAIIEKPEGEDLNDYLRDMNYEGYVGAYNFDEKGDIIGGEWIVEQVI